MPAPGKPSGNVENALCNPSLLDRPNERLLFLRDGRIPSVRNFFLPLSSYHRTRWKSSLELDNAASNANRDRLRAITGSQFFHNVFDVHFNGLFCDEQFIGDIAVTISAGDLT
jgi:hypothetical protein